MTLGEKIRMLRKQAGISQEQLADQLSVSRQAVSKWELDESMPDTNNLLQIGVFFNSSTDYLLKDDFNSHNQQKEYNALQHNVGYKQENSSMRQSQSGRQQDNFLLQANSPRKTKKENPH